MPAKAWQYDVFISYSRDDGEWVKENLHGPLLRSRRKVDGAPPRVFFDVSDEGVAPAANFIEALGEALQSSRTAVLVYSSSYFEKPMCRWEMKLALTLDPVGDKGFINPVLKDPGAAESVPFVLSPINYLRADSGTWFEMLCNNLDLKPGAVAAPKPVLRFVDPPSEAELHRPLAPVTVACEGIEAGGEPLEMTLSAEGGTLQGALSRPLGDGPAAFRSGAAPRRRAHHPAGRRGPSHRRRHRPAGQGEAVRAAAAAVGLRRHTAGPRRDPSRIPPRWYDPRRPEPRRGASGGHRGAEDPATGRPRLGLGAGARGLSRPR